LLLVVAAASPGWAIDDDEDSPAKEELIAEALQQRITIDVNGAALVDILNYVTDLLPRDKKISIVVDRRSIEEEGVSLDRPVSLRVNDIRLRSALALVLTDAGLDWTVVNEVLLVTTKGAAAANTMTRVYDVDDLVVQKGDDDRTPHFDELIELIQNEIAPDTWAEDGGAGAVHPFSVNGCRLVIRQTPQAHYEIARLLEELSNTSREPAEEPKAADETTPADEKAPAAGKDKDDKDGDGKNADDKDADGKGAASTPKTAAAEEMVCPRTKR
jgi:hypothetical protein